MLSRMTEAQYLCRPLFDWLCVRMYVTVTDCKVSFWSLLTQ